MTFLSRDDVTQDIVGGQLTADVTGAFGIADRLELGVGVPIILLQSGDEITHPSVPDASQAGAGLGDVRFTPTVLLFDANTDDSPGGPALSLAVHAWFPTGDSAFFQADSGVRIEPRLALDVATAGQTIFSVNVGWLIRDRQEFLNLEKDDSVTVGLGIGVPVDNAQRVHVLGEVSADLGLTADSISGEEAQVHANVGVRWLSDGGVMLQGGGGVGIIHGAGAPAWRGLLSASFGSAQDNDRDGDGFENSEDGCPDDAEDVDGFEDEDGCPDDDNDQDGIRDRRDGCPDDAEDVDGFEDEDGCPDADNDGDGVVDADDGCPDDAEDADGFEDEDGCPDTDNDGDGIVDADDGCPDDAEDVDDFEDEDGCPDADNDRDGIGDDTDACVLDPEDYDGFEDEDGCPEEGSGIVTLTCDRIEIAEAVHFETGSDVIRDSSHQLLDQIAAVLRGASYVRLVRVEGHTDSRGDSDFNHGLSQRRAAAVRTYLVAAGVDVERLESRGLGETTPIADNGNRNGRALNRRVEFHVEEQDSDCSQQLIPDPNTQ